MPAGLPECDNGAPVRVHSDVIFRVLGDAAVLVNLSTNHVFELNDTGAAIWTLLDRGEPPDAIVEAVTKEFEIDAEVARDHVRDLLSTLQEHGLLLP